jgi:hypothetical protein
MTYTTQWPALGLAVLCHLLALEQAGCTTVPYAPAPLVCSCDVCAVGEAPSSALQVAILESEDGRTLEVCPGRYTSLQLEGRVVDLVSEGGPDGTVILGDEDWPSIYVVDSRVSLTGFTFSGTTPRGGVLVDRSDIFVEDCRVAEIDGRDLDGVSYAALVVNSQSQWQSTVFEANVDQSGALRLEGGSGSVHHSVFQGGLVLQPMESDALVSLTDGTFEFTNNLVIDNDVYGGLARVLDLGAGPSSSVLFHNNVIVGNQGSGAAPSRIQRTSFQNNIVVNNMRGLQVMPDSQVLYNAVWGNELGDWGYSGGSPDPTNISVDPGFIDRDAGDFSLSPESACIDAGNPTEGFEDPDGTRNDMGAYGGSGGDW